MNYGSSFGTRVTSFFKSKEKKIVVEDEAQINIFTVASGLLYEVSISSLFEHH